MTDEYSKLGNNDTYKRDRRDRELLEQAEKIARETAIETIDVKLKELEEKLLDAFPDRDTRIHRYYHTKLIERKTNRKRFVDSIFEKMAGGTVWAVLLITATALWEYLRSKLK